MSGWGPFALGLMSAERVARLRTLRALVRVLCGSRGSDVERLLWRAETKLAALPDAATALDRLSPLDQRRVLSTYAALLREPRCASLKTRSCETVGP
jgi:hypothetical protein